MEISGKSNPQPVNVKVVKPTEATPESFKEYGQVIEASPDGEEFGPKDAQLNLTLGIPRFYIMKLEKRSLKFTAITHHANVTQCLGSIGGGEWLSHRLWKRKKMQGSDAVQSKRGHFYVPPAVDKVQVFRISGSKFIKLNVGTWHAGPLFKPQTMDFYNLELSNTNVVDHTTHNFKQQDGIVFVIDD
uniref:Ureidoglycolate hydrolase n=1 Tax=Salix viminalis TaxID=40686 RepID=A0A6N2M339_SALVM